jgi:hypothetical protein
MGRWVVTRFLVALALAGCAVDVAPMPPPAPGPDPGPLPVDPTSAEPTCPGGCTIKEWAYAGRDGEPSQCPQGSSIVSAVCVPVVDGATCGEPYAADAPGTWACDAGCAINYVCRHYRWCDATASACPVPS